MVRIHDITPALACTTCRGTLSAQEESYICDSCKQVFIIRDEKIFFEEYKDLSAEARPDALVYRLKRFLKSRWPLFFFLVYRLVNARVGPNLPKIIRTLPEHARIVNVGSGAKPVDPRVINVDFVAEPGVDLVANVYSLPFRDSSVDMLIAESIFEHLETPSAAVAEIHRVLKPGGTLFVVTPFMFGFHSSPGDYYRWTIPGMHILLKGFSVVDAGVQIGPTGAFAAIMREWLAILLSFNVRLLYQLWTLFFMVLLIPLNIFDWLISRYTVATQIAMEYYFIATKQD